MNTKLGILTTAVILICSCEARAQPSAGKSIAVTADNFIRAETDRTFGGIVKEGGFGNFYHYRELAPVANQIVQRGNRDTLYSAGIFDLDAGPVTITLPDSGKRFMTMIVIDEDHYVFAVVYRYQAPIRSS
jgi:hypothetical protein